MKIFTILFIIMTATTCLSGSYTITSVTVIKSKKKLHLLSGKNIFMSFNIALGATPQGHKKKEGDERTPEGQYILDYKNNNSSFYKSIHISYPNNIDIQNAITAGVSPGGNIMIHGQKNGFGKLAWATQKLNWTDGCIAVTNPDMDIIWENVTVGTPILILP